MSYINEKMALSGGLPKGSYTWANGKCTGSNGVVYRGVTRPEDCRYVAEGGSSAVFDFLKGEILPLYQGATGPQGAPSSSFTSAGLLLPAALVVGGVALLLILKKKK